MDTNPTFDKPLVPSLFQISDREASEPAAKDRSKLSEMMLNPRRLEAILKAFVKRKKSTKRTS